MLSAAVILREGTLDARGMSVRRQEVETDILQRAPARAHGVRMVGLAHRKSLIDVAQFAFQAARR